MSLFSKHHQRNEINRHTTDYTTIERTNRDGVINQTLFVPDPVKIPIRQYSQCINCKGDGIVYVVSWVNAKLIPQDCIFCKGLGEVEIK